LDPQQCGLLVTDLALPDGNGLALADGAARLGIRHVLISGDSDRADALTQQGRVCLAKPFTLRAFLGAVDAALGAEPDRSGPPSTAPARNRSRG